MVKSMYDLSKSQILAVTGSESTYYSFDLNGVHVVILDAQYDKNEDDYSHVAWMVQGLVPTVEMDWLKADLAASGLPTVVFIHQPLDSDFALMAGGPPVFNHLAVRDVLAADGDVIAVFSGHDHDANYSEIDGIHYLTIAAMVDHDDPTPLTWAMVSIDVEAGTIFVDGPAPVAYSSAGVGFAATIMQATPATWRLMLEAGWGKKEPSTMAGQDSGV